MNPIYEGCFIIASSLWMAYEFTAWSHTAPVRKMITFFFALSTFCVGGLKLMSHFGYIVKI